MTDPTSTDGEWRFDDLRALYINCTLKRSPEPSHTQGLIDRSRSIMERHGVMVEVLRAVDHDIATGVWPDMTSHGWPTDAWPAIYQKVLAAEILAGRQVGIRIEPDTLMFFDLQTRELLRVRPNPLSVTQVARLRGNRPAGPPPRPSLEPVRVQRRASNSGIVMVCGQKIALGRLHRWQTVTIAVSETTLAIELPDQEPKIVRRTTTTAARNIKAARPRPRVETPAA